MSDKFIVGIDILSISQLPCRRQNPNFASIDNFDETSPNKAYLNQGSAGRDVRDEIWDGDEDVNFRKLLGRPRTRTARTSTSCGGLVLISRVLVNGCS